MCCNSWPWESTLILAGLAGSGKTTFAKTLLSLLQSPSQEDMQEIIRGHRSSGKDILSWRPLGHPHHSTSPLGLIGGGVPPFKGEITQAHKRSFDFGRTFRIPSSRAGGFARTDGGILDPLKKRTIYRGAPRGNFGGVDDKSLSLRGLGSTTESHLWALSKKCQSYMERLSGPLVDRFQVIFFTQKRELGQVKTGTEILESLEEAQ